MSDILMPPLQPGRVLEVGYFYRDTGILAYGGDNPAAPGTVSIITDWAGLPAEPPVASMIVSPECLWTVAAHPEWWPRIVAVYISDEASAAALERTAETTRYLMQRLQLPSWPLMSYTATRVYPYALQTRDWLGVQLYAEVGQTPDDLLAYGRGVLGSLRHREATALICQAYDRADPTYWTDERLANLQWVFWQLAVEFTNAKVIALFSDGRKGGTRDHELMRSYHWAMVDGALAARGSG